MIYQHPLAYALALEGIALLRGFGGLHDREFVDARLAEVRELPVTECLQAALPRGLQLRRCEEPRRPSPLVDSTGTPVRDRSPIERHRPGHVPSIWALRPWCPDATNAVLGDSPSAIVWQFQLAA